MAGWLGPADGHQTAAQSRKRQMIKWFFNSCSLAKRRWCLLTHLSDSCFSMTSTVESSKPSAAGRAQGNWKVSTELSLQRCYSDLRFGFSQKYFKECFYGFQISPPLMILSSEKPFFIQFSSYTSNLAFLEHQLGGTHPLQSHPLDHSHDLWSHVLLHLSSLPSIFWWIEWILSSSYCPLDFHNELISPISKYFSKICTL